jgi:hypothetical protein
MHSGGAAPLASGTHSPSALTTKQVSSSALHISTVCMAVKHSPCIGEGEWDPNGAEMHGVAQGMLSTVHLVHHISQLNFSAFEIKQKWQSNNTSPQVD